LHWRSFAPYLARQFVDFEPGIHYSQVQMQSGTTGINTVRIYSPIKQALDQDPGRDLHQKLPAGVAVGARCRPRRAAANARATAATHSG
jgi:deoxyribodipyrimidine photo-lyase